MKIVRIIEVVDTREYEIMEGHLGKDKAVPIPGSGEVRTCDRCGRDHEVHAVVELEDGTTSVIGTGCAKSESMDMVKKIKSMTGAVKRLAKMRAELKAVVATRRAFLAARAEVEGLPLPAITGPVERPVDHGTVWVFTMDTEEAWELSGPTLTDSVTRVLTNSWRVKQLRGRGFNRWTDFYQYDERDLERRIEKAEAKLAAA